MKCRCGKAMSLCGGFDNPFPNSGPEYAYNLYHCVCGIIAKENLYLDGGSRWCCYDLAREDAISKTYAISLLSNLYGRLTYLTNACKGETCDGSKDGLEEALSILNGSEQEK